MAKSITHEIAAWVAQFRKSWSAPMPQPFPGVVRFFLALTGTSTSIIYNMNQSGLTPFLLSGGLTYIMAAVIAWFALLVSLRRRRSGPVRLYLDGLLLPLFIAFILEPKPWQ